jgi:hypothetical protein
MSSFTKKSTRAGQWVRQDLGATSYQAFIPSPLPPVPPITVDAAMQRHLESAGLALGRLDGIGRLLPGPEELLYSYVRKEAVLSSQIERSSDSPYPQRSGVGKDSAAVGAVSGNSQSIFWDGQALDIVGD